MKLVVAKIRLVDQSLGSCLKLQSPGFLCAEGGKTWEVRKVIFFLRLVQHFEFMSCESFPCTMQRCDRNTSGKDKVQKFRFQTFSSCSSHDVILERRTKTRRKKCSV